VLLEAATSTTREIWATYTCPECGKGFRQEISVPDHGARIKAVETLLREGLGRVGEQVVEPKMPTTVDEVKALSWDELNVVFAMTCVEEIRAVADTGEDALRSKLEQAAAAHTRSSGTGSGRSCRPRTACALVAARSWTLHWCDRAR
jgi:hypothetical protein